VPDHWWVVFACRPTIEVVLNIIPYFSQISIGVLWDALGREQGNNMGTWSVFIPETHEMYAQLDRVLKVFMIETQSYVKCLPLSGFLCEQDAAGQLRQSPHQFSGIGQTSPLLWLARGYAILDGASMPILAEGDAEPNDTFREQLVTSAEAAVRVRCSNTAKIIFAYCLICVGMDFHSEFVVGW